MATRPIYSTATEAAANELTFLRGSQADVVAVGVFHALDPNTVPEVAQFDTAELVDGTEEPKPALAEGSKIDLLSLVGTKEGAHVALEAGDWQRFALIQTASEDIIVKLDVLEIL